MLVLAGVVVGALAGAGISLVKVLADPYDQLPAITFWLLGSLAGIKLGDCGRRCRWCCSASCRWSLLRWRISVLSLGDEEAERARRRRAGRLRDRA